MELQFESLEECMTETEVRENQKAAIRQFIFEHSEELAKSDEALKSRAVGAIDLGYMHGWHQTCAVATDGAGHVFESLNSEQIIGSSCFCAERFVLRDAEKEHQTIETILVVRKQRPDEGTEVNVVSPCGSCREAIVHHNPNAKVILWFGGEIKLYHKVPAHLLLPMPYKERQRPTNGNGVSGHKFGH